MIPKHFSNMEPSNKVEPKHNRRITDMQQPEHHNASIEAKIASLAESIIGVKQIMELGFKNLDEKFVMYQKSIDTRVSEMNVKIIGIEAVAEKDYGSLNTRTSTLESKVKTIEEYHVTEADKKARNPFKKLTENIIVVGGTTLAISVGGIILIAVGLYIKAQLGL